LVFEEPRGTSQHETLQLNRSMCTFSAARMYVFCKLQIFKTDFNLLFDWQCGEAKIKLPC